MSDYELCGPFQHTDVLVRGRRVPMLSASPMDGGKVMLVFDHRLGLELTVAQAESVIPFIADVMENVMNPDCGRTFNRVHGITGLATEEFEPPDLPS